MNSESVWCEKNERTQRHKGLSGVKERERQREKEKGRELRKE